ncbi:MAG: DNA-directed RNA polymerase subunit N [Thaumarchaeota archaeon]|nr:DNA-directed RNA polymerase subunit N [Candidatus Calditenuaceae archaeon]MDW8186632.1 DNA-directed RNA polymerase subunit N [Nitrososphaerota archaeon]
MIFPIRCFSCGKPLAHLWEKYRSEVASGRLPGEVLNELNVRRYCCRRMFLTHVEYIDELIAYEIQSRQKPIRR